MAKPTFSTRGQNYAWVDRGGNVLPPHILPTDLRPFTILIVQKSEVSRSCAVQVVSVDVKEGTLTALDAHGELKSLRFENVMDVLKSPDFDEKEGYIDVFPFDTYGREVCGHPATLAKMMGESISARWLETNADGTQAVLHMMGSTSNPLHIGREVAKLVQDMPNMRQFDLDAGSENGIVEDVWVNMLCEPIVKKIYLSSEQLFRIFDEDPDAYIAIDWGEDYGVLETNLFQAKVMVRASLVERARRHSNFERMVCLNPKSDYPAPVIVIARTTGEWARHQVEITPVKRKTPVVKKAPAKRKTRPT